MAKGGIRGAIAAICALIIDGTRGICELLLSFIKGLLRLGNTSGTNLINAADNATKAIEVASMEVLSDAVNDYENSLPDEDEFHKAIDAVNKMEEFLETLNANRAANTAKNAPKDVIDGELLAKKVD